MKRFLFLLLLLTGLQLHAQDRYFLEIDITWQNRGECYRFCPNGLNSSDCTYGNCTLIDDFKGQILIRDIDNNLLDRIDGDQNSFNLFYQGLFSVRPAKIEYHLDYCEIIDNDGATSCETEITTIDIPNQSICYSGSSSFYEAKVEFFDYAQTLNDPIDTNLNSCESIVFQANNDCNGYRYRWLYSIDGGNNFISANTSTLGLAPISRNLEDYVTSDTETFILKAEISFDNGSTYTEESNLITYDIKACSLQLIPNETISNNVTCFGENDGSISLTFDGDVEEGYQMRYFVFQGNPSDFAGETDLEEYPEGTFPQVVTEKLFELNGLTDDDNDGNYSGGIFGLSGSQLVNGNLINSINYYIIYQEVKYDTDSNVTVKSGELIQQTFTIRQPAEIRISIPANNISQPQCAGDFGEVTVIAEGGGFEPNPNGPLEYIILRDGTIIATQTTATFSNLLAGNYTFIVQTSDSCSKVSEEVNIVIPSALSFSNPVLGTTSGSDGVIRVDYAGGTPGQTPNPNYTFKLFRANNAISTFEEVLNPNLINSTINSRVEFRDLTEGLYRVEITDSNVCRETTESIGDIEVSETPSPQLSNLMVTPISCNNANDATILVNATYPNPTIFFYELRDGTTVVTSGSVASNANSPSEQDISISNVTPGTYTLFVRASVGDFSSVDIPEITDPAPLTVSITAVPFSCFDATDGAITVVASGATDYQYRLNTNPTVWTDLVGNTISVSNPNLYRVTLRDRNNINCVSTISNEVEVIRPLEIVVTELNKTDATTNGGSDGTLSIEVTNGVAPYSYNWTKDTNNFTPPAGSTDTDLVGFEAGEYQVLVTDANGCNASLAAPIVIGEPGPLGITSLTPTDVLCKGENTGSLTAVVTGTPPFNYIWERTDGVPIVSVNNATITGLPFGEYLLRLTDDSAAPVVTETITVAEPTDVLDATIQAFPTSCFEKDDGRIEVIVNGGTAPYQYAIDDDFGFQASTIFTDLAPRVYTITVSDSNGCEFQTTGTITEPDVIELIEDNKNNVSVFNGTDGSISVTVDGGTAPYSYEWSGPNAFTATTEDITGLEAGTYTVVVGDANSTGLIDGCYLTQNFVISEPGPLTINGLNKTDVDCKGDSTGSITATVTGTAPFVYTWTKDGDPGFTAPNQPDITGLSEGIYILTLEDATTTPAVSQTVIIEEPLEALSASVAISDVTCFDGNNGSIQVNASGGTLPFTYSLTGGTPQNSNLFNGLTAASYDVRVTDANDCEFIVPNLVIVNEPQEIGLIIDTQTSLSSAGASDGAIAVTVFGGSAPYTYEWFANNGFTSTDEDINSLEGGNYTLIIRDSDQQNDADGCTYSQDFIIDEPGVLQVDISETISLECNGDSFGEITATVQGGIAPYTYEWFSTDDGNDTQLTEDTEIIANLAAGTYFVRVTDDNGIIVNATSVIISEPDFLEITEEGITDILCAGEDTGAIDISIIGGTAPYQYVWSNGATTEDILGLLSGEYTLEVIDANFCSTERSFTIAAPPDALRINDAQVTNLTGYLTNDGSIDLDIIGGLAPYAIVWTRLSDTTVISDEASLVGLEAGDYEVTITDANACGIMEIYEVTQPDIIDATIVPPVCFGEANGSISLVVNQGNGTFAYSWSTGETTSVINSLGAGSYTVSINGLGDHPVTRTYILEDPLPLEVDLGEDRVLCKDQTLSLDAMVDDVEAVYQWTSDTGFTSSEPTVNITGSGNYNVTVSLPSGCTAMGNISVAISTDEISAEFAMSSQVFVGESLMAVDISYPLPETLEWVLPVEANIIQQDNDEAQLVFSEPGEYEIGIQTSSGDCIATRTKKVMVLARDATVNSGDNQSFEKQVEDFMVYPNPSSGRFTADVKLTERGNISIKIFSFANNSLIATEKLRGETSYSVPMDISGMPPGVYAVVLETPYGTSLRKIIIG